MDISIETRFTKTFGLQYPIVQGPLGGVSGPMLVAAVSNAGGLGVLPIWSSAIDAVRSAVKVTKSLTDNPFAVNVRADLCQIDHIRAAIDTGVDIIHLFWGDPTSSMQTIHMNRARMIATVGDTDAAKAALDAGATALVAQGVEAGGHVLSELPLRALLHSVLEVANKTPVIAAGGLIDADDVAEVLSEGASGALLGTCFVATQESDAHEWYKQALIEAGENSTVRSICFDGMWPDAPHRTLKNSTYEAWMNAGRPVAGKRPGEGDIVLKRSDGKELPRYSIAPPAKEMTGELEAAALYAGTGVAKLTKVQSATSLVRSLCNRLVS